MEFIHWATIGDEPAGMCWNGDCYPDVPQKVSTKISEVTCPDCLLHHNQIGWGETLGHIQSQLDSMTSEQLGAMLSKAHIMKCSADEAEKLSGQLLYYQVLAALEQVKA